MTKKQHVHAEVIKAWADGAQIEFLQRTTGKWINVDPPAFIEDYSYRVKPGRSYPETLMVSEDLKRVTGYAAINPAACIDLANAALRHAIDNGQVVTREEFALAIGDRDKRDMAVAQAVIRACAYVIPAGQGAGYIAREMTTAALLGVIAEVPNV